MITPGAFFMRAVLLILSLMVLSACAGRPDLADEKLSQRDFELEEFFDGHVVGYGQFQDRFGTVRRRFEVQVAGEWDGEVLTLTEDFAYADASTERRVWTLTRQPDGNWQGTADDVEGVAQGTLAGNAFHWRYTLRLPVDGRTWLVDLDDRMYLVDDNVMLNRAVMSKWGFTLGSITLSFYKP